MKQDTVPQDTISTYDGNKKAMYATDDKGNYTLVASSGWEVEEAATMQAVHELQRLTEEARSLVLEGSKSPLFYHMYARRMDIQILAEATGIFKWRIKRHFSPKIFHTLSAAMRARYADALGLTTDALASLPPDSQGPHNG